MILDAITKQIEILLGAAVTTNQLPCTGHWVDHTATTMVPGETSGPTVNPAGVLVIVDNPAASTYRQVKHITIYNADTVATTVTVQLNDNGTLYILRKTILPVNSTLFYQQDMGWNVQLLDTTYAVSMNPPTRNTAISTTLLATDYRINVTSTAAARTITIPSTFVSTLGRSFEIWDSSGGAGLTPIILDTAGAETINGNASIQCVTAANGMSYVYSDGTNWWAVEM